MEALHFANLIQPEHDRIGCSDKNVFNGFGSASIMHQITKTDEAGTVWRSEPKKYAFFRCSRCAILEILQQGYVVRPEVFSHMEDSGHYPTVLAAIRFKLQ